LLDGFDGKLLFDLSKISGGLTVAVDGERTSSKLSAFSASNVVGAEAIVLD